jgi:hypothetical protein
MTFWVWLTPCSSINLNQDSTATQTCTILRRPRAVDSCVEVFYSSSDFYIIFSVSSHGKIRLLQSPACTVRIYAEAINIGKHVHARYQDIHCRTSSIKRDVEVSIASHTERVKT